MTSAGATRLLEALEASWRPLRASVDAIGIGALEQRTRSGWTVKELVAHVAFWEEAVEGFVTLVLRGQSLPDDFAFGSGYELEAAWPPGEVHNQREAAWARERGAAEVITRWDGAHARLERFLESVSDAEAREHAEYFESHIARHLDEHRREVDALGTRGDGAARS